MDGSQCYACEKWFRDPCRAASQERQDKVGQLATSKESLEHELEALKYSVEQLTINSEQLQKDLQAAQAALESSEAARIDAEVRF